MDTAYVFGSPHPRKQPFFQVHYLLTWGTWNVWWSKLLSQLIQVTESSSEGIPFFCANQEAVFWDPTKKCQKEYMWAMKKGPWPGCLFFSLGWNTTQLWGDYSEPLHPCWGSLLRSFVAHVFLIPDRRCLCKVTSKNFNNYISHSFPFHYPCSRIPPLQDGP